MDAPVSTKHEVLQRLTASSEDIRSTGVRRLGLFGSFVRDGAVADSDVDLLVEFDPGKKSFDNFWGLSQLLEFALQRRVDLLTTESLSPYMGPQILAEVEYVPSDSDLLRHMRDEADYLIGQRGLTTRADFLADATLQRAFSRSIEILGEAVKQLSSEIRDAHPDVPYKAIAGMRDRLIHGYFAVDYEIVWDVVENKIDEIRQRIVELLGADAS